MSEEGSGNSRLGEIVLEKYCPLDLSEDEDDPDNFEPMDTDESAPKIPKQSSSIANRSGNPINRSGNPSNRSGNSINRSGNPTNRSGNPINRPGNPINRPVLSTSTSMVKVGLQKEMSPRKSIGSSADKTKLISSKAGGLQTNGKKPLLRTDVHEGIPRSKIQKVGDDESRGRELVSQNTDLDDDTVVLLDEEENKCYTCCKDIVESKLDLRVNTGSAVNIYKLCEDCVLKLEKRSLVATKKEYKAGQILTESKVIVVDSCEDYECLRCFKKMSSQHWTSYHYASFQEGILKNPNPSQSSNFLLCVFLCDKCSSLPIPAEFNYTFLRFPVFNKKKKLMYFPPIKKTCEKSALPTYPVSLLAFKASSILDRFKDQAVLREPPRHLKGNMLYIHNGFDKDGNWNGKHWGCDGYSFIRWNTRKVRVQSKEIEETVFVLKGTSQSEAPDPLVFRRRVIKSTELKETSIIFYSGIVPVIGSPEVLNVEEIEEISLSDDEDELAVKEVAAKVNEKQSDSFQTVQSLVKSHLQAPIKRNNSKKRSNPKTKRKGIVDQPSEPRVSQPTSVRGSKKTKLNPVPSVTEISTINVNRQITTPSHAQQSTMKTVDLLGQKEQISDVLHTDVNDLKSSMVNYESRTYLFQNFDGKQLFKAVPLVTKDKVFQGSQWIPKENVLHKLFQETDRLGEYKIKREQLSEIFSISLSKKTKISLEQDWDSFLGPFSNNNGVTYLRIPVHCDYMTAIEKVISQESFITNEITQQRGFVTNSLLILDYFTNMKVSDPYELALSQSNSSDPLAGLEDVLREMEDPLYMTEDPLACSYDPLYVTPNEFFVSKPALKGEHLTASNPMVVFPSQTSQFTNTDMLVPVKVESDEKKMVLPVVTMVRSIEESTFTQDIDPLSGAATPIRDIKVEPTMPCITSVCGNANFLSDLLEARTSTESNSDINTSLEPFRSLQYCDL